MGASVRGRAGSFNTAEITTSAPIPTGTLMKKIQRHDR